jgi:hypothetical protein
VIDRDEDGDDDIVALLEFDPVDVKLLELL